MNYSIFKSRTFWTAVLLGAYNLGTLYMGMFANVTWLPLVVNGLGMVLVTYFHVNPSQQYNQPSQG